MSHHKAAGSLGAHISWSNTVDRAARTRAARRNSPGNLDYWLERQSAQLQARPMAERIKAAENAKAAHFKTLGQRSAAARRTKKVA